MIDFRDYLRECMDGVPAITGDSDAMDFQHTEDRDAVNFVLSDITDQEPNPDHAYERVRGILHDIGYLIPPASSYAEMFLEGYGEAVIPLVHTSQEPAFLYFAYASEDETENYEILAEIVTQEELEEILYENPDAGPV